ncbi:hypothetical protein, partial [Flavonifractor plautii]|uniref:hypothetical protein n=1 Tax=Flavonifractor plautii TaxID=292800 RepID=UPI003D7ECA8E
MKFTLGALVFAAILAAAGTARADAREVATRVADQWKASGAKASVLPAKFLFDDDRQVIPIAPPKEPAA